jgi:hypothetical protein
MQSMIERFARIILGGILLVAAAYIPMGAPLTWLLVVPGLFLLLTGLAGKPNKT